MATRQRLAGPRDLARFWRHVERDGPAACWPWTAAVNADGYGRFRPGGRAEGDAYAHRWIYAALVGPVPEGQDVHHTCGCRRCVNPAHLALAPATEHRPTGLLNHVRRPGPADGPGGEGSPY